jgi:hypothetical protein
LLLLKLFFQMACSLVFFIRRCFPLSGQILPLGSFALQFLQGRFDLLDLINCKRAGWLPAGTPAIGVIMLHPISFFVQYDSQSDWR